MKMRIAILAVCAGALVLAGGLAHASGLPDLDANANARMNENAGTKTTNTLPKTQQGKVGSSKAKSSVTGIDASTAGGNKK